MTIRSIQRLLVTGGAGFIGSAFIRYLLSPEVNFGGFCLNFDLLTYAGNLQNLSSVASDSRYFFVRGDINHEKHLCHLVEEHAIDTILHFAAESHVDRSITGPEAFIRTNIQGTFHLLEVVRKYPHLHFHHVSTDEVYGSLGDTGSFTEESPYRPNSPYSASKAASDHLVRAYRETYGLSTCISHCSNNYGPYHFPEKLIPLVILNCLQRQPLPIYGTGKNIRDWLFVEDHAKALWLLLTRGASGETYNIGGRAEISNLALVRLLVERIAEAENSSKDALESLITFVPDRPGHDFRYAIDCTKIEKELSWRPAHTLQEGLDKTVSWYMSHPSWLQRAFQV